MFKKIDISNFGSFNNFVWRDSVRDDGNNVLEFKRLNIFYGRNYSGKTTLSRILRSCQEKRFPPKYADPRFTITTDTEIINQNQIASHAHNIRVYNKDFVVENLSVLVNHDGGEIKTFAIIGSENKELENLIKQKEAELGSADSDSGLKAEYAKKTSDFLLKKAEARTAEEVLTERLRRRANDVIKHNRVYGHPGYNLPAIQEDIKTIQIDSFRVLDEEQIRKRNDLLREEELPSIEVRASFNPQIEHLLEQAQKLLAKEITPTQPIQELLNDAVLQTWVKTGMSYHKGKRITCGFCRQSLPDNLWEELDSHFSKESSELEEGIRKHIEAIETEIELAKSILTVKKENFYTTKHSIFDQLKKELDNDIKVYEKELNLLIKALRRRQNDIFKSVTCPTITDNTSAIVAKISEINNLIVENNKKTETLGDDKNTARIELRLNDVSQFIQDIDLYSEEDKVKKLTNAANVLGNEAALLQVKITTLVQEIESYRVNLKDEKKGAEKINEFLNHFFGHSALKLEAIEDTATSSYKFQVMRAKEPAYNLSEGECSLIAFCYFIAKLEDTDTKGKELILYIDDPISSLDSNHIFFVYSLIESVITKPNKKQDGSNEYRYKQLFISTHNLDFFKYLKRLSHPNNNHGGAEYFIVEWDGSCSRLSAMPRYLKDYTTEFNYLFHQIYKCRNATNVNGNHECFYNFGNNLRKFLEAYLFYKYPYHDDKNNSLERLTKFFGNDSASTALTNRISNELSHLEEIFDRSMRPIEIPEIPKLAAFVLDKIFEKDKEQYNALLESIGEPPRI